MNLDGDIEGSNDKIFFKDVSFEFRSVRWDTFILCRQGKKRGGEFLGGGELIGRIRYVIFCFPLIFRVCFRC